MYESLNCFESALQHFGTRVEMITAMEMAKEDICRGCIPTDQR